MRYAAYAGLAAAALALIAAASGFRQRAVLPVALAGLAVGGVAAWVPWHGLQQAKSLPPIHDVSTDTEHPPEFVAVLPLRGEGSNSAVYGGAELAAQQTAGYPDLAPLTLPLPPLAAFSEALDAAKRMGWQIVAADLATGRIEATATTFWFGFKDDVVVRVTAQRGGQSRIDVRSLSRIGGSDIGANAARIRRYLRMLGQGDKG
jgi:uncharacterized protein (DUF1499 family)